MPATTTTTECDVAAVRAGALEEGVWNRVVGATVERAAGMRTTRAGLSLLDPSSTFSWPHP